MKRIGKYLGIAILPQGLQIAEVTLNGGGAKRVAAVADLSFTEELSLKKPLALGKALSQLLRDRGFSARDVIFGLPARWLLVRPRQLPPATPEAAAASLRLQAESEFASEVKDLSIDYIGDADRSSATTVLLVGTARGHVESCIALSRDAGLRTSAITVTSTAVAATVETVNGAQPLLLNIERGGAELVQSSTSLLLRHLSIPESQDAVVPLASDIRRTIAGLPPGRVKEIHLSDAADILAGGATALQQRLHIPVTSHRFTLASNEDARRHTPAIALALAGFGRVPVDFLHSRLAVPKDNQGRRRIIWGAAIAAALLIIIGLAAWDLSSTRSELEQKQARLNEIEDEVKSAQLAEDRLKFVRTWSPRRERYVACLSDLTRMFPDEGVIWVSSVSIRADLAGQFSGKATGESHVLALLDKLQDSRQFVDAKLLDMRDGGAGREIAYSISFTYRPRE